MEQPVVSPVHRRGIPFADTISRKDVGAVGIFRRKARQDGSGPSDTDAGAETHDIGEDPASAADGLKSQNDDATDSGDLAEADDNDSEDSDSDGPDADSADADPADADPADAGGSDADDVATRNGTEAVTDRSKPGRLPRPHDLDRTDGPFDRSEVDDLGDRLDFGSLAVQPVAGMELRLDVDEEAGNITGLTAVLDDSACQVQVFAAPKSSGIWDDIRDDIADGLITGGGTAVERLGPLGIELAVGIPGRDASGRTTLSAARFAGIDGPRWFLRAVYSGAAATDDEAAASLLMFVRNVVVLRGSEARAPRELLELKVPDSLVEAAEQEGAEGSATGESLDPFERGPEITEVR